MTIKLIGAVLILLGCGWVGFSMAAAYRSEEETLHQIIRVLDHMGCELQYRMTPLPDLCRNAATVARGGVRQVWGTMAELLQCHTVPNAQSCMRTALEKAPKISPHSRKILSDLGETLGRFDLHGQMEGLDAARQACRRRLDELSEGRDARLRSYQTLGLCAGAALAVLFF